MGLLDYADSARKKLAGLLGDMPLVQMAQGRAEMPTMGGLLASLKSMPVFSPDAGQSAYEAALNIGPMGLGKIVYHGSPHKFDKFDASKIGTGEGAQAYGHGQYLADAEGVAKDYAKRLGNQAWGVGGDNASGWFAEWAAPSGKQSLDSRKYFKTKQEAMEFAKSKDTGEYLYKADLPDEWIPKMLDWDKPLSEQSKDVRAALSRQPRAALLLEKYPGIKASDMFSSGEFGSAPAASAELAKLGIPGIRYLDGGSRPKNIIDADLLNLYEKHGGNAQRAVDEFMGHVYESPKEKARMAAQFMKKLENAPTYNYVVFPGLEDQVKILERNGIPLSGLLGGK